VIILEGPDGTGKSTLAQLIQNHYGLEPFARGTNDRSKLYEVTRSDTYRGLADAVGGFRAPTVADRLYYSELVYADIVGRPCEFNVVEQGYIERIINAIGMPVVVCCPPLEVAQANALKDEQMDDVNEHYAKIYNAYQHLINEERFPEHAIIYDYTADDAEQVLDEIRDMIESYTVERKNRICELVMPV
jgi:thymidylate kinase